MAHLFPFIGVPSRSKFVSPIIFCKKGIFYQDGTRVFSKTQKNKPKGFPFSLSLSPASGFPRENGIRGKRFGRGTAEDERGVAFFGKATCPFFLPLRILEHLISEDCLSFVRLSCPASPQIPLFLPVGFGFSPAAAASLLPFFHGKRLCFYGGQFLAFHMENLHFLLSYEEPSECASSIAQESLNNGLYDCRDRAHGKHQYDQFAPERPKKIKQG